MVIASHILGKAGKADAAPVQKRGPETGERKKQIFRDGSPQEQVDALVASLKKDGYDFTVGIPLDTPIVQAERVVSAGKGIGEKRT